MIIIGERINGTFKDVRRAIQRRDKWVIQKLALGQLEAGADFLNLSVGPAAAEQEGTMAWLVETIQEVTEAPLALDSPKLNVIKAGLEKVRRPPMINSTPADPEQLKVYMNLAIDNDASIIALTLDKQGVPMDVDRRVELAGNIVMTAMELGYPIERLFIDPVIQPVKFAQTQADIVLQALGQIRYLSDPPPHLVVGLRNISPGIQSRALLERTYLVMCIAMGLDAAIMDPFDKEMIDAMITAELLLNKHIYSDSFLAAYRTQKKGTINKSKRKLEKLAAEETFPVTSADGKKRYGDGWLEEQHGFSILHLKGSPYDMGYQQGMLTKEAMDAMVEPAQIWDEGTLAYFRERIKRFDEFIPAEYHLQMHGLADALETSYDDILLWHTFGDVRNVSRDAPPVVHCSNFLAFGEATADGKVVHGANLEFGDIVKNRMLTNNGKTVWLAVYEPDSGHRFAVVLAWPQQTMISGYFGVNDAGLTISQTFLPAKDSTLDGTPMFILLRKVIQYADSVPAALRIVQETQRTYGTSMMFADGKTNQGTAIEYSSTQHAVRESVDGTLFTMNRMLDERLYEAMGKGLLSDEHEEAMLLRAKRYAQLFEANYGQIDVKKAVDFLRDHLDLSTGKDTISFPGAIGSHMVVSSVVFQPADFDFWVARGVLPMAYGEFVGFNLKALLAGEKSKVTPARIPRDAFLDSDEFNTFVAEVHF